MEQQLFRKMKREKNFRIKKNSTKPETISYDILQAHNIGEDKENLKIKFDAITSHDLTYVGIIQTARARESKNFHFRMCLPAVITVFVQ